jgi:hypothetical protein
MITKCSKTRLAQQERNSRPRINNISLWRRRWRKNAMFSLFCHWYSIYRLSWEEMQNQERKIHLRFTLEREEVIEVAVIDWFGVASVTLIYVFILLLISLLLFWEKSSWLLCQKMMLLFIVSSLVNCLEHQIIYNLIDLKTEDSTSLWSVLLQSDYDERHERSLRRM